MNKIPEIMVKMARDRIEQSNWKVGSCAVEAHPEYQEREKETKRHEEELINKYGLEAVDPLLSAHVAEMDMYKEVSYLEGLLDGIKLASALNGNKAQEEAKVDV